MAKRSASAVSEHAVSERDEATTKGRGILTQVNPEGLKALRFLAVENDTTLQALAIEAFNDLLKKYGKRALVKNPRFE